MKTREDVLKQLRSDPLYKSALKAAKTDEERRRIIATTEAFVGQFADALLPIINKAESDPLFREQLQRSLVSGEDVVSQVEPVPSGSQG